MKNGKIEASDIISLLTGKEARDIIFSEKFVGVWASVFGKNSSLLATTSWGSRHVEGAPIFSLYLTGSTYRSVVPATLQLINIRKRRIANCL